MITREDVLKKKTCPSEFEKDLDILVSRLNKLENLSGCKFEISSGYRSMEEHIEIYKKKGLITYPTKSKHLYCQAADLVGRDLQRLKNWIVVNDKILPELELWFEDFNYTKNWLHCQIVPPVSKHRFFIP